MEESLTDFILQYVDSFDMAERYGMYDGPRNETFIHCPFHTEGTPSARFYTDGLLFCFGCNRMFSPLDFVMEFEDLGFKDALKWLEKEYDFQTPEDFFTRTVTESEKEQLRSQLISFKYKLPFRIYKELWGLYDFDELNTYLLNSMILGSGVL